MNQCKVMKEGLGEVPILNLTLVSLKFLLTKLTQGLVEITYGHP